MPNTRLVVEHIIVTGAGGFIGAIWSIACWRKATG